jgi:hypothetical protein
MTREAPSHPSQPDAQRHSARFATDATRADQRGLDVAVESILRKAVVTALIEVDQHVGDARRRRGSLRVLLPRDSSTRALRRPRPDPRARSAAGRWVLTHRALPRALSELDPPAAEATHKPAPSPSDPVSRTRDGWTASNRGYHDFQSCGRAELRPRNPWKTRGLRVSAGLARCPKAAKCMKWLAMWATRCRSWAQ